jgi:hypothetical protein
MSVHDAQRITYLGAVTPITAPSATALLGSLRWRFYMPDFDLTQKTPRELLALFSGVLEQLRACKVVRSGNNPVADYCEALVHKALGLEPFQLSNKGCDAWCKADGKRYEIKARRITKHNPSTQLSAIRGLDEGHFDYLVGVLLDENFNVTSACCIPRRVVKECATYRKYVNGWIMHLRPSVWKKPGVLDITEKLQKAQGELENCTPTVTAA